MEPNKHVRVATDKQARRRILPSRLTASYRGLRDKYLAMPGDTRADLVQRWRFDNVAADDRRYDPILPLLVACADCAGDPKRRPAVREFAAEFKDAVDALCAGEDPLDFVETLHRETRAQGVADSIQTELTAHPDCPNRLQRWIDTATAHRTKLDVSLTAARQKLARLLPFRGNVA